MTAGGFPVFLAELRSEGQPASESWALILRLNRAVDQVEAALSSGHPEAADRALGFLEADPYFFRSGYAKQRLARRLAAAELSR